MNGRKQRHTRITPLNPPELAGRRKRRELAGEHPREEQAAYLDRSEVDTVEPLTDTAFDEGELPADAVAESPDAAELSDGENLELLSDIAAGVQPVSIDAELAEIENLELLADIDADQLLLGLEDRLARDTAGLDLLTDLELRAGETAEPLVASDEGSTYVPPIDPPVIPGSAGSPANAVIASGLGVSALDEPYDEWHHSSFLPDDDEVTARVRDALRADSSTWQYADTVLIETRDGQVILRGLVDDLIDNDNLLAVASDVAGVTEVVDALRVRGMEARA
jgi:BON domain